MKHTVMRLICVVLALTMLTGCGGAPTGSMPSTDLPAVESDGTTTTTDGESTTTNNADTATTTTTTTTTITGGNTVSTDVAPTGGDTVTTAGKGTAAPTGGQNTPTSAPAITPTPTVEYVDGLAVVKKISGAPLCEVDDNLYKLDVPFENIYTAVFFLRLGTGEWAVIDTATTVGDVNNYILPAATALGITTAQVKAILLTHNHLDHAGGLATLLPKCANATVYGVEATNTTAGSRYQSVQDGTALFGGTVQCVTLRGHSADACGWLDTRSKTIMTGDSIQFYGAGQYGCQLYGGLTHYTNSIEKLQGMIRDGAVENIVISHRYVPVTCISRGKLESREYMTMALSCYEDIRTFTIDQYAAGNRDASAIQSAFITERRRLYDDFPTGYFSNVMATIINQYCR